MPLYRYTATNAEGRTVEGTLQATAPGEAAALLSKNGLKVKRLAESSAAAPSAPAPQAPTKPDPTQAPTKVRLDQSAPRPQQPVQIAAPKPAAPATVRTRHGSDGDLYFIFSQLQSYAKAGLSPNAALMDVANKTKRADYRKALMEASNAAAEGIQSSRVFERYPNLFPEHVVGGLRAGEAGGYTAEALGTIVQQVDDARKIKRWASWLTWVTLLSVLSLPPLQASLQAALRIWDLQEQSGGGMDRMESLKRGFGAEMHSPTMWIQLGVIIGGYLLGRWILRMRATKAARHQASLIVPSLGKRAKNEAMRAFSWHLGMASRSGLAPNQAWELAVGAVPNVHLREGLRRSFSQLGERGKISEGLRNSRLVPEELAPMVNTGEITGDVPGALFRAAEGHHEQYMMADKFAKAQLGCWMWLILTISTVIGIWLLYDWFYPKLQTKALDTGLPDTAYVMPIRSDLPS